MIQKPKTEFIHTLRISAAEHRDSRTRMQLTLSQLQHLADDFDLGRVIKMDAPFTTQCNTTDPFKTGRGTFLLRARHGEEFVERVEYLHMLIDYLVSRGFPAAKVIRSKEGNSCTTWGDRIVEIHSFIPHDPGIHRDWQRMHAAASILGDLHHLLSEASAGKTPVGPEMRNDVSPKQCWQMLNDSEARLARDFVDDPELPQALEIIRTSRILLEPLLRDYERIIGSLPWMTVHGDYHFWNLLYRADQIAGVVDYDFAQERERIFDIAYAMQSVITHLYLIHGTPQKDFHSMGWQNARMWVDHYDVTTHLPLTKTERRWLPKELLRIYLVGVATSCSQADPIQSVLQHGCELGLYSWLGKQDHMFDR